jgi:hypothetical protein
VLPQRRIMWRSGTPRRVRQVIERTLDYCPSDDLRRLRELLAQGASRQVLSDWFGEHDLPRRWIRYLFNPPSTSDS